MTALGLDYNMIHHRAEGRLIARALIREGRGKDKVDAAFQKAEDNLLHNMGLEDQQASRADSATQETGAEAPSPQEKQETD